MDGTGDNDTMCQKQTQTNTTFCAESRFRFVSAFVFMVL